MAIIIIIIILLSTVVLAGISLAPWVPCRTKDLKRIFKLAKLQPNEIFYDIGCDNGKTVIYANKHFGAKAIGIELAFPLFLFCKIRQLFNRDKSIIFKYGNLFKVNFAEANVVYVFGMPDVVKNRLKKKLERELKSGTRVISYVFPIEGWEPIIIDKPHKKEVAIYLYQV